MDNQADGSKRRRKEIKQEMRAAAQLRDCGGVTLHDSGQLRGMLWGDPGLALET